MVDFVSEVFAYSFMRNALAAGLLTVVASSLVGTWVVMRGLAFMGDALSHGVLPGIALAYLLGMNLVAGAALSAVVMVFGVSIATTRRAISEDTAIGLLFVGMLALGVAIISARGAYAGDLTTILFGDPLAVTSSTIRTLAIAAALATAFTLVGYRPFLALSFNRSKAQVLGLHPRIAHLCMLGLVAMVVVASFRAVGTLLVVAFLIAPAATAVLLVRRTPIIMLTSIGFGSTAVLIGLLVSYRFATATSATIAGLSVLGFFIVLAATSLVDFLRRRHHSAAPAFDFDLRWRSRLPAASRSAASPSISIPESVGENR